MCGSWFFCPSHKKKSRRRQLDLAFGLATGGLASRLTMENFWSGFTVDWAFYTHVHLIDNQHSTRLSDAFKRKGL